MNNQIPKDNKSDKKGMRPNQIILFVVIAIIITFFAGTYLKSCINQYTSEEISYSSFLEMIDNDEIKSIEYDTNKIVITPIKQPVSGVTLTYYTGYNTFMETDTFKELIEDKDITVSFAIADTGSSIFDFILVYVLPFVLIYLVIGFMFKRMSGGGGMLGVGKSNAKVYVEQTTGITFKDVAGQEEAKESVKEIVDFLHHPDKYTAIGAKLPKGALLVGPPGTGKTLLAKAVAGEAGVPFFSLSGSDFVEMFVGVGASRVRDLFKQAQQSAPCIIFIDEIDAIGKSRDSRFGGGNDEREQTLNQLLAEMDGFDSSKGVLILAATNRPEVLDKALLRPGRFDRRVIIDRPDLKGRVETLKVHSKDVLMDDTVDLDAIALATAGAVGSDLANMMNEAAINAVKNGRKAVSQADLFESVEVVIAGKEKKDRILGKEEKRMVAYHEVGHALITCLLKNAEPVQKITIIPRTMGSLGYTLQVPEEEKYLLTKDEMITRIITLFGGRAAEEIVFDTVTTGASNDIERATEMARAMVSRYGMSERFGLMGLASVEDEYLNQRSVLNCSDKTASILDEEVNAMLKEYYDKAKELLLSSREQLDRVTEYLIEKESITGKEFMNIVNGHPADYEEEVETSPASTEADAVIETDVTPVTQAIEPTSEVTKEESGE